MRSWMIGMILGIFTGTLWSSLPGSIWVLPLVVVSVWLAPSVHYLRRLGSGILVGAAVALLHGNSLLEQRLSTRCVNVPITVEGYIASMVETRPVRNDAVQQRFEFVVEKLDPRVPDCGGLHRLSLAYYGADVLQPAERWRFTVRLKKPRGLANPASFDAASWYAQRAIDAVGSVKAKSAHYLSRPPAALAAHHRLRQHISDHIKSLDISRRSKAVLRAITVADKTGIDQALWQQFQHYGINHLLVISGLHIALLAGLGYGLGVLLIRPLLIAGWSNSAAPVVLSVGLALAYAALAGFSLSTQRALLMLVCVALASLFCRSSASGNTLLVAAAAVLLMNPLAILGSGFWLSFFAVAALLWLGRLQSRPGWVQRLFATHLFMAIAMVPMGALWFGGASVVAPVANFVMIPVIGVFVVPLALLATLAFVIGAPTETVLWSIATWPLELVWQGASVIEALLPGNVYYAVISATPATLLLALAGVFLLALPGSHPRRFVALLLILPIVLLPAGQRILAPGLTRVTVLDAGQGTAVIIRSGARTLLYDTGGGDPSRFTIASAVILPYLQSLGIGSLDTFIISHRDADHSAGAAAIVAALPIRRLLSGQPLTALSGGDVCRAGHSWRWPEGPVFRFLSPALETGLSSNNGSCTLQVDIAGYRLLLPGDIHSERERALIRYWREGLRSNWLLLAHHGSNTSSSASFLKTVSPDIAVVSAGYANSFGHPHPAVLRRLATQNVNVLSTIEEGAISFDIRPGSPPTIISQRRLHKRWWM
tara:strand:+ start:236636 stop:238942 length:2307 start_codon:yes stop_codon:yes gene_type:complete